MECGLSWSCELYLCKNFHSDDVLAARDHSMYLYPFGTCNLFVPNNIFIFGYCSIISSITLAFPNE